MSRTPNLNIDYTNKDYESFKTMMIQSLKEKMPEYTDLSETDAGIVILEALANGLDILSLYTDVIANDVFLSSTQDRRLAVLLAKNLGYTPYNQTASEYQQVFVLSGPIDEDYLIPKGTLLSTKKSLDLASIYFETMEDLIIPKGKLGNEKDDDGNYLYSVRIQSGTSIYRDMLGTSTGAPLQSFKLNYTNVLTDSIELYINEGSGPILWTRVDSFLDCNETSRVFMVTVDEFNVCSVEFGNGLRGKIPREFPNGISANYRIGGGTSSNVGAGIITEIETSIAYVESTFNLDVSVRGHDKESIESIKENAPASFRTRDRLITLDDYSDLLRINFYDFLQLKSVRDEVDKKLVHIFYMMKADYEMTPELAEKVTSFITERSMIGTTFDLNPYVAEPLNLNCVLYVDKDYNEESVKANVISYLENVVFAYGELQFEDNIVKSDLENEIKKMFDGILSFRINSPEADIIVPSSLEKVLTLGSVNITSKYL